MWENLLVGIVIEHQEQLGLPSFLNTSYYFGRKDVILGYTSNPAQLRDQEFQRISLYKLNQPYLRGGIHLHLLTFSIFDKPILSIYLVVKYFLMDISLLIIDEIKEYQKAFMEVVSEIQKSEYDDFPSVKFFAY